MTHATTWMTLKIVILRESARIFFKRIHTIGFHLYKNLENAN